MEAARAREAVLGERDTVHRSRAREHEHRVGDVVPGGLAEDRGDYSKGFLVSDLRVTTFRPGGGLEAVKQALGGRKQKQESRSQQPS